MNVHNIPQKSPGKYEEAIVRIKRKIGPGYFGNNYSYQHRTQQLEVKSSGGVRILF